MSPAAGADTRWSWPHGVPVLLLSLGRAAFYYCLLLLPHMQVIQFDRLPPGTIVRPRQYATNMAGQAGVLDGGLFMLDDTPPIAPALRGCSPGSVKANGVFVQSWN